MLVGKSRFVSSALKRRSTLLVVAVVVEEVEVVDNSNPHLPPHLTPPFSGTSWYYSGHVILIKHITDIIFSGDQRPVEQSC